MAYKDTTIALGDLSKYPKVPVLMDAEFLHENGIFTVKSGWYCLPVINGLTRYSETLLTVLYPHENETNATMACHVHNTFDGKMTEAESWALIGKEAGF